MYVYIYIYICRERERQRETDRETEREREREIDACVKGGHPRPPAAVHRGRAPLVLIVPSISK